LRPAIVAQFLHVARLKLAGRCLEREREAIGPWRADQHKANPDVEFSVDETGTILAANVFFEMES
jgi:hypothetical protein